MAQSMNALADAINQATAFTIATLNATTANATTVNATTVNATTVVNAKNLKLTEVLFANLPVAPSGGSIAALSDASSDCLL
jgi:hypothetical protein